MKNIRENITIALVVIYIIGFVIANKSVSDSCTHGNCKHGWNSKYNKEEKNLASLWIIGFPIASYLFVTKVLPEPPKKPRSSYRSPQRAIREEKTPTVAADTTESPICPKCNSSMKIRVARKGKHAGKQFWGCSNFPRCNGIVNKVS